MAITERQAKSRPRLITAAILLGMGLGGFVDGILFHQILQWHHMVSTPVPPTDVANIEINTLADGLFHAATWVVTVAGIFVLLASEPRRERGARRVLVAGALAGWGLFNVVEGLVNHHLLGLHHVRPGPDALLYDVGFLMWGLVMLAAGTYVLRRDPAH